jgi:hypothetical protein
MSVVDFTVYAVDRQSAIDAVSAELPDSLDLVEIVAVGPPSVLDVVYVDGTSTWVVRAVVVPVECWCAQCGEPSTEVVGETAYCADHAGLAKWKLASPSWRGARS